ncbi:MAG: hypothetical protein ABR597_14515 [Bacteroidales bacterium]
MLLIYGNRTAIIARKGIESAICSRCDSAGRLVYQVHSRHLHVFWIPLFSAEKYGSIYCEKCRALRIEEDVPDELYADLEEFVEETKAPPWQYTGIALAIMALIIVPNFIEIKTNEDIQLLSKPQVGDIYEFITQNNTFSTLQVIEIDEDSIWVAPNRYSARKIENLNKIKLEHYHYPELKRGICRENLIERYQEGEILKITRK